MGSVEAAMKEPPAAVSARHEKISRWLSTEGRLDVVEAAQRLGVAQETVRRDLRTLESEGRLQRVHGGAVTADANPFPSRTQQRPEDDGDLALGARVWEWLPRCGTILLGAGRLTLAVAHAICDDPPREVGLTVVTSSLDAAITLARLERVSVYNLGGTVAAVTRAQEGDWALQELDRLHVDVGLVCPAGLSVERGLSQPTPAAAAIARAEVACSQRLIALADAETLGAASFVRFAGLADVDRLVVAGPVESGVLQTYRERGVEVEAVEAGTPSGASDQLATAGDVS